MSDSHNTFLKKRMKDYKWKSKEYNIFLFRYKVDESKPSKEQKKWSVGESQHCMSVLEKKRISLETL